MQLDGIDRVMVITAHYDDLEFTAGGLVSRLTAAQKHVEHLLVMHSVSYVRWTDGSVRSLEMCQNDARDAQAVLEYETDVLRLGHEDEDSQWPVDVSAADNELVHLMEERVRTYSPGLVVIQSPHSTHPGHRNVAEAALAATRRAPRVITVEPFAPDRRMVPFRPTFYVALDRMHLERKCEALVCFRASCGVTDKDVDTVQALARVRGHEAGVDLAEAYELVRWVL